MRSARRHKRARTFGSGRWLQRPGKAATSSQLKCRTFLRTTATQHADMLPPERHPCRTRPRRPTLDTSQAECAHAPPHMHKKTHGCSCSHTRMHVHHYNTNILQDKCYTRTGILAPQCKHSPIANAPTCSHERSYENVSSRPQLGRAYTIGFTPVLPQHEGKLKRHLT